MANINLLDDLHSVKCTESGCSRSADVVMMLFNRRQVTKWETLCAEHATKYSNAESHREISTEYCKNRNGFLAVELSLMAFWEHGSYFVLRDGSGHVNVPFYSGAPEGYLAMQRFYERLPDVFQLQMHEVFVDALPKLGWRLDSVALVNVVQRDGTEFYESFVSIVQGDSQVGIQVRPSDAVAIALCGLLPIFVTERVLSYAKSIPIVASPWATPEQGSAKQEIPTEVEKASGTEGRGHPSSPLTG